MARHKIRLINQTVEDRFETKLIDTKTGEDLFQKYTITRVNILIDANNSDRPMVTLTLLDVDVDLLTLTSDFTLNGAL